MIELRNINKRYLRTCALHNVYLKFPSYGFISIVGESGCGKSTLLNVIGNVDQNYEGEIYYDGKKVRALKDHLKVSYIFQQFHLIPFLNPLENKKLYDVFHYSSFNHNLYDLSSFEKKKIKNLSLGQRQRIAIERALYFEPDVILCDEPTASLDHENSLYLLEKLKELSHSKLIIFVSHDLSLVEKYSDQIYYMEDGEIVDERSLHEKEYHEVSSTYKRHFSLNLLKITRSLIHYSKKRFIEMSFACLLAMISIMLVFTLSFSFRTTLNDYIHSLFPASAISFKGNKNVHSFDQVKEINHVYYYNQEYELLGLSFNSTRYNKGESLFIQDESQKAPSVQYGRTIQNNHEIILPLSTAKKLSQDVSKLINHPITIYYKHNNRVKGVLVNIVGISPNNVEEETFYQKEFANIEHLKTLFGENIEFYLGILYYQGNKEQVLKSLHKNYPDYAFKVVGESTEKRMNDTMDKVEFILFIFTFFSILAALFMIATTSYLLISHYIKDFCIMLVYGAKKIQIIFIILLLGLLLHTYSYFLSFIIVKSLINILNETIIPQLFSMNFEVQLSINMMQSIYEYSLLLIFICLLFSIIKIVKVNIIDVMN